MKRNATVTLNNADESAAAPIQEEGGQITETLDNPYTVNAGSGYGTFVIGNANETVAGSSFNVGTYATIFTGGSWQDCFVLSLDKFPVFRYDAPPHACRTRVCKPLRI